MTKHNIDISKSALKDLLAANVTDITARTGDGDTYKVKIDTSPAARSEYAGAIVNALDDDQVAELGKAIGHRRAEAYRAKADTATDRDLIRGYLDMARSIEKSA